MFDVGFTELFLLLVVGLIVLGPERLPKVARTIGLMVGRARAMYTNVRSDIERELELEELKRAREAIRQQLSEDATGPIEPTQSTQSEATERAYAGSAPEVAEETASADKTAEAAASTPVEQPAANAEAEETATVKDKSRNGGEG